MTDRLQAYEVFAALVEQRNFTGVSKALGVPQPTISKHIASLEATLGVQLFVRSTRRTTPTAEAFDILPSIRQMLEANEEIKSRLNGKLPAVSGRLRIAAPASYARHVLLPRLAEFRRNYQLVELDVVTQRGSVDPIGAGMDLALTDSERLEGPYIQRLVARHAWRLAASPEYLARHGAPLIPADLAERAVVLPWGANGPSLLEFESENGHESVQVSAPLRCDDVEMAIRIAAMGDALVIVPDWILAASEHRDNLQVVLDEFFLRPISIHLIYPATQFLPARTRALIDFLAPSTRWPAAGSMDRTARS